MKGPSYTDEEMKLLQKLAKKGGSPSERAKEFMAEASSDRSEGAILQKLRKMMVAPKAKITAKPAERKTSKKETSPTVVKPAETAPVNAVGGSDISVEVDGVKISGPRKRVGEVLQQLS